MIRHVHQKCQYPRQDGVRTVRARTDVLEVAGCVVPGRTGIVIIGVNRRATLTFSVEEALRLRDALYVACDIAEGHAGQPA